MWGRRISIELGGSSGVALPPFAKESQEPVAAQEVGDIATSVATGLFSMFSSHGQNARLTILLFHKIPRAADPLTPTEPLLTQFEFVLDYLQAHANVLPLRDAVDALGEGNLPRKAVAVTFDDGYDDWLDTVSPALRKRDMPATFFVTTEQMAGPALWHERIVTAVRSLPDIGARLPYGFSTYADLQSIESRIRLITELTQRMKYAPLPERLGAVELLEAQAQTTLVHPKIFNCDAVRQLHSQGFEIGAHTISHPILNECDDAQALQEIGGCKEELEAIIGGTVDSFAYPNGRPEQDYLGKHVKMVRACGYRTAVATSNGSATAKSDRLQLPRFSPWATTTARLALQLTRNLVAEERKVLIPIREVSSLATPVRCLLVANTFTPMSGQTATDFENLCMHMPRGSVRVLTTKLQVSEGSEIDGRHEHDAAASFAVDRIACLCPPTAAGPPANIFVSLFRFAFRDLPLYANVFFNAANIVNRHRINVVCVGELVTGSWLGIALKHVFGTRLIIYVQGNEISAQNGGRLHGSRRKAYLEAADKIVAANPDLCDVLTSEMGIRPDRILLVQNGVDVVSFTPSEKDPELFATEPGRDGLALARESNAASMASQFLLACERTLRAPV